MYHTLLNCLNFHSVVQDVFQDFLSQKSSQSCHVPVDPAASAGAEMVEADPLGGAAGGGQVLRVLPPLAAESAAIVVTFVHIKGVIRQKIEARDKFNNGSNFYPLQL